MTPQKGPRPRTGPSLTGDGSVRGQGRTAPHDAGEKIQEHRALLDGKPVDHRFEPPEMLGRHIAQALRPARGQDGHRAAPVLRGRAAGDQTLALQAVQQAGDGGPGDTEVGREVRGVFSPPWSSRSASSR